MGLTDLWRVAHGSGKHAGRPRRIGAAIRDIVLGDPKPEVRGTVQFQTGDLGNLGNIKSNSIDAVVSISSLEHNSPERLRVIVAELLRVIRPGGKLVATICAAKDADEFHEPSQGQCYRDSSLREIFDLAGDSASNYDAYDELFTELRNNAALREGLASFYFQSGDNGMPWGRWNPQYQPVGVVKVKLA